MNDRKTFVNSIVRLHPKTLYFINLHKRGYKRNEIFREMFESLMFSENPQLFIAIIHLTVTKHHLL